VSDSVHSITLIVEASSRGQISAELFEEEVQQLQDDLRELNSLTVERIPGIAAPGSKSGEGFALGSFLVALAPEMVKQAITVVFDWLRRDPARVIKIRDKKHGTEYEITGAWKAAELSALMKVLAKEEPKGEHST
jgi:hypothetical protein